jgi:hypothetical protein
VLQAPHSAGYTAERDHAHGEQDTKISNFFAEVNRDTRKLKDCSHEDREVIIRAWGPFIYTMMQGLRRLPPYEGCVYRGMREPIAEAMQLFPQGRVVRMAGFASTTTNLGSATALAGTSGTVLMVMPGQHPTRQGLCSWSRVSPSLQSHGGSHRHPSTGNLLKRPSVGVGTRPPHSLFSNDMLQGDYPVI